MEMFQLKLSKSRHLFFILFSVMTLEGKRKMEN